MVHEDDVEALVKAEIRSLHPSLNAIASTVLVKYNPEVLTACVTENWVVMYGDWFADLVEKINGPNRWSSQAVLVVRAVVEHEIQHVMRGHFERGDEIKVWDGGLATQRWKLATDLEINGSTASCEAFRGTLPGGTSAAFPEDFKLRRHLTAESYYDTLSKRQEEEEQKEEGGEGSEGSEGGRGQKQQAGGDKQSQQGNREQESDQGGEQEEQGKQEGQNGDGQEGQQGSEEQGKGEQKEGSGGSGKQEGKGTDGGQRAAKSRGELEDAEYHGCSHGVDDGLTAEEREAQWKRVQEAAAKTVVASDDDYYYGNRDPAGDQYVLRVANLNRRWQKALAGAIESYVKRGHGKKTYGQPARRGNFNDGVVRPGEVRTHAKVAVVVDVSGSMEREAIDTAVGVIAGLTRQLGSRLHVSLVDGVVQWQGFSANGRDILKRLPRNGGGTDFSVMLDAGKKIHPEVIVLLTDCAGLFPLECNVPVVIGQINSNSRIVGRNHITTARVSRDDLKYIREVIKVPLQPRKGGTGENNR